MISDKSKKIYYKFKMMKPEFWQLLWNSLHLVTFLYPKNPAYEHKLQVINLFNSLKSGLPCQMCKSHYVARLRTYPIENFVNNKDALIKWLVDIHNSVNAIYGKKAVEYSIVYKQYENLSHIETLKKEYNLDIPSLIKNKKLNELIPLVHDAINSKKN